MLFTINFCIVALVVCAFIGAIGVSIIQVWSMMK